MAVGNTFGATALSSYGGFWLSFAVILTPGGFAIEETLTAAGPSVFPDEFGLYLMVSQPLPQSFVGYSLTLSPGLVHLHNPATRLHPTLNTCLLLPLLQSGHGIPAPRHRLPTSRRRGLAKSTCHKGWRLFRIARGILGLV